MKNLHLTTTRTCMLIHLSIHSCPMVQVSLVTSVLILGAKSLEYVLNWLDMHSLLVIMLAAKRKVIILYSANI